MVAGSTDLVGLPLHAVGSLSASNASDLVPFTGTVPGVPIRRSAIVFRTSDAFAVASIGVGTNSPPVAAAVGLATLRRHRLAAIGTASVSSIPEFASVSVTTIRGRNGPPDPRRVIAGSGHFREASEQRLPHARRHPIEPVRDGPLLFR